MAEYHLQIPVAFMGGLIGLGGRSVKKLSDDTGCEFRIAPKEKADIRLVVIAGQNIQGALESMFDLFEAEIEKAEQGALASKDSASVFTFKIIVGPNQVGAIIGKGGKGAENLRETFKCGVKIKGQGEVELEGTIEAIKGATINIWLQISSVVPARLPPVSTQFGGPEILVELVLPDELVGMLIGKKGETISAIRRECRDVTIEIPSEKQPDGKRRVVLKGCCSATARAHVLIATHIESDERTKQRRSRTHASGSA